MQNSAKKSPETIEIMRALPLFCGADISLLSDAVENGAFLRRTYSHGDIICCPEDSDKRLVILVSGRASVYSADESRSVLLRRLEPGKCAGVANLFSHESFVSRIIADKRCETVEISAECFGKLLLHDGALMHNYISFLSNKICLLNKKIVYLTAGSAERRLALFLEAHAREVGNDSFPLPMPMNNLSEMLNLGRASLYRAADALEADGCISRVGKQITIVNKELMLSKYT